MSFYLKNDSLIKIVGSKEQLQYRTLYSNTIEELKLQCQLNIFCNNKLEYNAHDDGMKSTTVEQQHDLAVVSQGSPHGVEQCG